MPNLPIESYWLYAAYLCALSAGLYGMQRRSSVLVVENSSTLIPAGPYLIIAGLMAIFTLVISEPPRLLEDFREAYLTAGAAVWVGPAQLAGELARGVEGFVNLPILAYFFTPLALMPGRAAELVFTLAGLATILLAWWLLVRAVELDRVGAAILLLIFCACGPLHNSVKEGNTSHFALALLAAALLAIKRRRDFSAGVLLGVSALVKLPLLLFGLYYLLRKRWRVVLGGGVVCGAAGVLSLVLFGWELHVKWYENAVAPFSDGQILAFNVQSVRAFLGRLEFGSPVLMSWEVQLLPQWLRNLATVVNLALLSGVAVTFLRASKGAGASIGGGSPRAELEFSVVLLLACLTSPLTWSHYYTWLLLPIAVLMGPNGLKGASERRLLWAAVVLGNAPVLIVDQGVRQSGFYAKFLVSHYVLAAVMLAGLSLWVLHRSTSQQATIPPQRIVS